MIRSTFPCYVELNYVFSKNNYWCQNSCHRWKLVNIFFSIKNGIFHYFHYCWTFNFTHWIIKLHSNWPDTPLDISYSAVQSEVQNTACPLSHQYDHALWVSVAHSLACSSDWLIQGHYGGLVYRMIITKVPYGLQHSKCPAFNNYFHLPTGTSV